VFSQSNYKPGLVVLDETDTVRGFINAKEWERTPRTIQFKTSADAEAREYTVADVSYFSVDGFFRYRRFTVTISMNEVSIYKSGVITGPAQKVTAWLKVVTDGGYINLYSFKDDLKQRFLMAPNASDTPVELYYEILKESGKVRVREGYKNQLTAVAILNNDLKQAKRGGVRKSELGTETALELKQNVVWTIKKTKYTEGSLLKAVSVINGTDTNTQAKTDVKRKSNSFFISTGLSINSLESSGGSVYAQNAKSDPHLFPYLGLGLNLYTRPEVEKLFFRFELMGNLAEFTNTSTEQYTTSSVTVSQTFRQKSVSLGVHIFYNFVNTEKIKVNLGAGARVNLSSYDNESYNAVIKYPTYDITAVLDQYGYHTTWFSFPVRSSVIINRRLEAGITYVPPVDVSKQGVFTNKVSAIQIGAAWHLH
jgi:hypothetical protein